jgi:glycine dehydrogenase
MKMDKPGIAVARRPLAELEQHRGFVDRHIGTTDAEQAQMLKVLGYASRSALIDEVVPPAIRLREPLALPAAKGEQEALDELKAIARKNHVLKSFIDQCYYGTLTPGVILRNVLENPRTAYTPTSRRSQAGSRLLPISR